MGPEWKLGRTKGVAMQPQDTTTLRGVVHELNGELVPSPERAQQAESGGVQLAFRTLKQRLWLTLNWQADCPRFHAIEPPPRLGEGSTLASSCNTASGPRPRQA